MKMEENSDKLSNAALLHSFTSVDEKREKPKVLAKIFITRISISPTETSKKQYISCFILNSYSTVFV